jgi:GxxExxY protein
MSDLLMKDQVFLIVGAAMEVHNMLGSGFLEPVYQEALQIELADRRIPFEAQKAIPLQYKGHTLRREYIPDFVCYSTIILEIKALDRLTGIEEGQVLNYLKATGLRVGLLVNFGRRNQLEWKRFVR